MKHRDGAFIVLFKDDWRREVFLVYRSDRPIWNLTGGGGEPHETPEQTVLREAHEETDFTVQIVHKVGVYNNVDAETGTLWNQVHLFEGRIVSGTFKPEFPGCKGQWFSVDALPRQILPITQMRVDDALAHSGTPFEKEHVHHGVADLL